MTTNYQYITQNLAAAETPVPLVSPSEGRKHFIIVCVLMGIYGAIGVVRGPVGMGNHLLKVIPTVAVLSLAISRTNWLAMLGFASSMYFGFNFAEAMSLSDMPIGIGSSTLVVLVGWLLAMIYGSTVGSEQTSKVKATWTRFFLGAFVVWSILGLAGSSHIRFGWWFTGIQSIIAMVAAFDLGVRSPVNRTTIRRMIIGIIGGYIAIRFPVILHGLGHVGGDYLTDVRREFGGSGADSGMMLMLFAFSVGICVSAMARRFKLTVLILGVIPSLLFIFLLLSKGAILIACGIMVLSLFLSKRKVAAVGMLIAMVLVAAAAIMWLPQVTEGMYTRFANIDDVILGRAAIRSEAWHLLGENPVFGIGVRQYHLRSFGGLQSAHNEGLQIAAENGCVGLAIYSVLVLIVLVKLLRSRKIPIPFRAGIVRGVLFTVIAYAAYTQIQPLYFTRRGLLFFAILGLLYAVTGNLNQAEVEDAHYDLMEEDLPEDTQGLETSELNSSLPGNDLR